MEKKENKPVKTRTTTKKPKLNETVKVSKNEKSIIQKEEILEDSKECIYCHKHFEKGMSICPYCRKKQNDSNLFLILMILTVVFILVIIGSHFITKYKSVPETAEEYKASSSLVAYENLVRYAKNYKNQRVKIIGKVTDVEGYDDYNGNNMVISLNANLFNDNTNQTIQVKYLDKDYNKGLLEGDIITVYGVYESINGNIPSIKAEYIVFGQESA